MSPTRRSVLLALVIVAAALTGTDLVMAHGGSHSKRMGPVTQEERDAYAAAKPVFERHCFRCHTTGGRKAKSKSLTHLTMDRYPFGGHHAAEIGAAIRQVLGAGPTSKKATMPSDDPGAVTADELAKVLAWADAFDRARPAPKPRADEASAHH